MKKNLKSLVMVSVLSATMFVGCNSEEVENIELSDTSSGVTPVEETLSDKEIALQMYEEAKNVDLTTGDYGKKMQENLNDLYIQAGFSDDIDLEFVEDDTTATFIIYMSNNTMNSKTTDAWNELGCQAVKTCAYMEAYIHTTPKYGDDFKTAYVKFKDSDSSRNWLIVRDGKVIYDVVNEIDDQF